MVKIILLLRMDSFLYVRKVCKHEEQICISRQHATLISPFFDWELRKDIGGSDFLRKIYGHQYRTMEEALCDIIYIIYIYIQIRHPIDHCSFSSKL
jgi:hypothetical protein